MTTTYWVLMAWLVQGGTGGADGGLGAPDAGSSAAVHAPARPVMTPEVLALVERIQAFYETTEDFTADFRQEYSYAGSRRSTTSSGTVLYKKPARMRWEYLKPSARTFVLAQERAYMFDPEAKLLTRADLATNKLSASVTFLWGQGKLAEEFSIAQKPCPSCEAVTQAHPRRSVLLELTPLKADPRFKKVLLEADSSTAQVLKSTVIDPDGSVNAISFLGLKTNTKVEDDAFKLTVPAGTQLQDFLTPDAGSR